MASLDELALEVHNLLERAACDILPEAIRYLPQDEGVLRSLGLPTPSTKLARWMEQFLFQSLTQTFRPGGDTNINDRYEEQFAATSIKVRTKESRSVARALMKCANLTHRQDYSDKREAAEELIASLMEGRHSPASPDRLRSLLSLVPDTFGARVVVLTQRAKMSVVRGLNLLIYADASVRFFCRQPDFESLFMLELSKDSPPWKLFNPPANFLYSAPDLAQRYFAELPSILQNLAEAAKKKGGIREEDYPELLNELYESNIQFDFKQSGYATYQRTIYVQSRADPVCFLYPFELQVRTVLEDSWAEPEHRFVYKSGKPLSESAKALFRNYAANLRAADDLLQMIADQRQEEVDDTPPLNQYAIQDYIRRPGTIRSLRNYRGLDRDLGKLYSLRNLGHITTALSYIRRLLETNDWIEPEVLALLWLEYSFTLCQQKPYGRTSRKIPSNYREAKAILTSAKELAKDLVSESFFIDYRMLCVDWLICRFKFAGLEDALGNAELSPEDEKASQSLASEFEVIAKQLRSLYDEYLDNDRLRTHISSEYIVDTLQVDLALLEQNALLHSSMASRDFTFLPSILEQLSRIRNALLGMYLYKDRLFGKDYLTFGDYDRLMEPGDLTKQSDDLDSSRRLMWPLLWCDNLLIYAQFKSLESNSNDSKPSTKETISFALNDLRSWRSDGVGSRIIDLVVSYVEGTSTHAEEHIQKAIDRLGLEPLKIVDSVLSYLFVTGSANPLRFERLRDCIGMLKYRLVEISYLSDFGLEEAFYRSVCRFQMSVTAALLSTKEECVD